MRNKQYLLGFLLLCGLGCPVRGLALDGDKITIGTSLLLAASEYGTSTRVCEDNLFFDTCAGKAWSSKSTDWQGESNLGAELRVGYRAWSIVIGGMATVTGTKSKQVTTDKQFDLGTLIDYGPYVSFEPSISENARLIVHAQLGYRALLVGGDLRDEEYDNKAECAEAREDNVPCYATTGPYYGTQAGFGLGASIHGLRLEWRYTYAEFSEMSLVRIGHSRSNGVNFFRRSDWNRAVVMVGYQWR